MVSQVGDDQLGNEAIAALREHGVVTDYVSVSATHPTGTVVVELDAAGKPSFSIGENVAWDHLVWSEQLEQLAARTDAVCFGTLGQRCESSRRVIEQFVSQTPRTSLRILDVNLRPPFDADEHVERSLGKANILKLSDDELDRVAAACGLSGSEATLLDGLGQRFDLQLIALTRGKRGATLYRDGERSDAEGISVQVKDTVGAGDAFTACLITGMLARESLSTINQRACRVAAFVCGQNGATPSLPNEYR
jgi:fructokinase